MKLVIEWIFFFSLICFCTGFCSSSEIKTPIGNKTRTLLTPSSPKSLRLTYDVEWKPSFPFALVESGQMHESGNTYRVTLEESMEPYQWLKISSTSQDNQRRFPYLRQTGNKETSTYYFPQKKIKAAVQVQTFPNFYYVRWEGVYHGFLLVAETEIFKDNALDPESIGKKCNDLMYGSLELF